MTGAEYVERAEFLARVKVGDRIVAVGCEDKPPWLVTGIMLGEGGIVSLIGQSDDGGPRSYQGYGSNAVTVFTSATRPAALQ